MAVPQSKPVNVFYYDRNEQRLDSSADINTVRYNDWNVGCGTNNEMNIKTSIINR